MKKRTDSAAPNSAHKKTASPQPVVETQAVNPEGFYRIHHIIGDKRRDIEPLLPISRSSFLAGIKSGKYPKPVKLTARTSVWPKAEIHKLLATIQGA